MASIMKGKDLMLFIGGKSIAYATNHTLSISGDTTEISCKDFSGMWAASEVTSLSWTASSENLMPGPDGGEGKGFNDLYAYMVNGTQIEAVFGTPVTTSGAPSGGYSPATVGFYKGTVVITSLEVNAQNGENATYSVQFQGVGELAYNKMST